MIVSYRIRLDLYPHIRMHVLLGAKTAEEAFKEIGRHEGAWIVPDNTDVLHSYGFVVGEETTHFIVIIKMDDAIIVHELIHATWRIMKALDTEFNYDNQELQAYLFEYLYKKTMGFVEKHKKEQEKDD